MDSDYPASHSMDTSWFAVDEAGCVGLFDTGENGHAPDGEDNDVRGELWDLVKPAGAEEDWPAEEEMCEVAGVYYFSYVDDLVPLGSYARVVAPDAPLHVDQLPPEMRRRCRLVRFPVRFDQVEEFQPLEHVPCVYWYDERVAYLCGNGRTVKPIPGKEGEFAQFVREFRQDFPERANELIFDGPLE
jgi:hypothetical protein